MAFPGTYNFNYYRGDTFSFIIRPKDTNGNQYPLDGYTAEFKIANRRGSGATQYTGTATVNTVDDIVTCTISPTVGRQLTTTAPFVYDVQITNGTIITTLLQGTITVTDDITGAV